MEKIAALRPDLILALYSGLTKEQYDTLSKFAPVVAQPKEYSDYGIPWQRQTETIGKALGRPEEATKLVEGVEAKFAEAKMAQPGLRRRRRGDGHPVRGHVRLRQPGRAFAAARGPRAEAARPTSTR